MITPIEIDESLFVEAIRLTGVRSAQELVGRALQALVSRSKRPSVLELFGIDCVDPDYDPKSDCATTVAGGRRTMR
jgi:hypothetical protein